MKTNNDVKILGYRSGNTKIISQMRLANQQPKVRSFIVTQYYDSDLESVNAIFYASILVSTCVLFKLVFFA